MNKAVADQVWRVFGHRCVQCKQRGTELNHIVPRSEDASLISDWHNIVPLCHTCHTAYHQNGVTEEKIAKLRQDRADFLIARGKEIYI